MNRWQKNNPATVALARGQTISVRTRGPGWQITCVEGRLWVTMTRRVADSVLDRGENVTLHGRGLIVIEALRDATARLEWRYAAPARTDRYVRPPARLPGAIGVPE